MENTANVVMKAKNSLHSEWLLPRGGVATNVQRITSQSSLEAACNTAFKKKFRQINLGNRFTLYKKRRGKNKRKVLSSALFRLLNGSLHTQKHKPYGDAGEREGAHDRHNAEDLGGDVHVGSQSSAAGSATATSGLDVGERLLGALRHPHVRYLALGL